MSPVAAYPDILDGKTAAGSISGPASYPGGGFTLDLTATFKRVDSWGYVITGVSTLGPHHLTHTISGTVLTLRVWQERYDNVTAIGQITPGSQPAGVTIATTNGQLVASESAHTHDQSHDHAVFTSAAAVAGGAGVNTVGGVAAMSTHTHPINIANLTVPQIGGAGTAHNHADNNLYQHNHAFTTALTDCTIVEIGTGVNISAANWRWIAEGVLL